MAAPKKAVGPKSDKMWRDAIMLAIKRDPDGKGKHIDKLARTLIAKAADGDVQALKEIGDRLDGKPSQSVGLGQAEDLAPLQHDHALRPTMTKEDWLQMVAVQGK